MLDDPELLRHYADEQSEDAFAELVRRHLNLVYFAALRRVGGDAALAKDVTQHVFIALARQAKALSHRPVLASWLYTTARYISATVVRTERRRRAREQEAHTMQEIPLSVAAAPTADWAQLRPVLDLALDDLSERDREAILLRFFEARPFSDIAEKLRLTEDAARMRVERALDKMHGLLARRGVTSTTAALAVALASEAGAAAPAGLATLITGGALTGVAATAGTGAVALLLAQFMSTTKILAGLTAVALLGLGTALYQTAELRKKNAALTGAVERQAASTTQTEALAKQLAAEQKRAEAADQDNLALVKTIQRLSEQKTGTAVPEQDNVPITHDLVESRYKHAHQLAQSGDYAGALNEYLWCYDVGMPRVVGYGGVRGSFLLGSIMELAKNDPAAMTALRDRRDAAEKRLLASESDNDAAMDFSSLNRELKENDHTLAVYDQLPIDDPRRRTIAGAAYEQFVTSQRYADAVIARPYAQMSSLFDLTSVDRPEIDKMPNAAQIKQETHNYVIESAAGDIEVLAGAGDVVHARAMADKLFGYDSSDQTRAIVLEHAARAGHADLFAVPARP